mmetsp:Transcript_5558/g.7233  ORF Transcript_5558/g.7233 Transcript_5558/m.7233 type:complete len:109 (+) Transcript_5558:526-852(+)
MTVLPFITVSIACFKWNSLSESRALVASSNTIIGGSFNIVLAMATLCFCPPERPLPRCPTSVSRPSGRRFANSRTCATLAASLTSSSVASSLPYRMLSAIVPEKRRGS